MYHDDILQWHMWWHITMTYLERFLICHRVSSPWCRITTYVIRYVIEGGCHHDRHQICHCICHCMSAYVIACHCGFQNVRDDTSWWHIMMTYQIWYMSWFRCVIMICHRADMSSWYVIVTFSLPMLQVYFLDNTVLILLVLKWFCPPTAFLDR